MGRELRTDTETQEGVTQKAIQSTLSPTVQIPLSREMKGCMKCACRLNIPLEAFLHWQLIN